MVNIARRDPGVTSAAISIGKSAPIPPQPKLPIKPSPARLVWQTTSLPDHLRPDAMRLPRRLASGLSLWDLSIHVLDRSFEKSLSIILKTIQQLTCLLFPAVNSLTVEHYRQVKIKINEIPVFYGNHSAKRKRGFFVAKRASLRGMKRRSNLYNNLEYISSKSEFSLRISSSFFNRDPPFICFSLNIASATLSKI